MVLSVIGSSVLLLAAVAKLLAVGSGKRELLQFSVPRRLSRLLIVALSAFELLLGIAVLLLPGPFVASLVAATGMGFALVGLSLHKQRISVRCNCFGSLSRGGELGMRQVAVIPLWFGLAAGVWTRSSPSTEAGMWSLLLSSLLLANAAAITRVGAGLWSVVCDRLEASSSDVLVTAGSV